ncbi:MAG TPA: phosphoribosylanthranilate isomerase [Thermomicrobiales bacterium]|nr:phosphoribosylanthranilate isomerase [Thermomicrobiales bacterium]
MTASSNQDQDVIPPGGVKICGIREPRHALAAVEAGADMLGFVFAPSRRQVTAESAMACIEAIRGANVTVVGLFVNAGAETINRAAERLGLDAVQLHGDVSPDLMRAIDRPVIRAINTSPSASLSDVHALLPNEHEPSPVAFQIDGFAPGARGGTGVLADWSLAAALAPRVPLVLAGGLTSENVSEAIRRVAPRAVDVSSGVETDGVKDEAKIHQFVEAAKRAFATSFASVVKHDP